MFYKARDKKKKKKRNGEYTGCVCCWHNVFWVVYWIGNRYIYGSHSGPCWPVNESNWTVLLWLLHHGCNFNVVSGSLTQLSRDREHQFWRDTHTDLPACAHADPTQRRFPSLGIYSELQRALQYALLSTHILGVDTAPLRGKARDRWRAGWVHRKQAGWRATAHL